MKNIFASLVAVMALGTVASAQVVDVAIHHFAFIPPSVSIVAGTSVRWTNHDSIEHTATSQTGPGTLTPSGVFDSGLLNLDDVFQFTFTQPGTYHYYCIPHGSSMQGVVTVTRRCVADFNGSGGVNDQDIFDFLIAYFASDLRADVNSSGAVSVQDVFDFLVGFVGGCT